MAIGQVDFSPLLQSSRLEQDSQRFVAGNLINLGQQITKSISEKNMRDEAQQMAPLLAQQYQGAFENLQNGQVGTGMGQIAEITAAASRNPLLAQMTHQMNSVTDNIINNQYGLQRQQNEFGQQYGMEGYRQYGQQQAQNAMADRQEATLAAQQSREDARQAAMDKRQGLAIQASENKQDARLQAQFAHDKEMEELKANLKSGNGGSITPNQQRLILEGWRKNSDDMVSEIKNAKTKEEWESAMDSYKNWRGLVEKAGMLPGPDKSTPYLDETNRKKLEDLDARINEYSTEIAKGNTKGWFKDKKYQDLINDLQTEKNALIDHAVKGLEAGATPQQQAAPAQQSSGSPEGTKIKGKNGEILIKRNGKFVPLQ